jgi:putative membrane protein
MFNKGSSVFLAAAAMLIGMSGAVSAKTMMSSMSHSNMGTNATDRMFTRMAAMGGTAEIALSKVALMRSDDPKVKQFAQTMIHDHLVLGHGLAVTAHSVNLPAPMVLDAQHRALRAKLMHMSGKSLDTAYMAAMINDHAKTVSLFQNEIAHGKNIHVTNLATKNVNVIQNHLQMAHDLTGTQDKPSKIKNPKTASM